MYWHTQARESRRTHFQLPPINAFLDGVADAIITGVVDGYFFFYDVVLLCDDGDEAGGKNIFSVIIFQVYPYLFFCCLTRSRAKDSIKSVRNNLPSNPPSDRLLPSHLSFLLATKHQQHNNNKKSPSRVTPPPPSVTEKSSPNTIDLPSKL